FLGNNQGNITLAWDFPKSGTAVDPPSGVTAPANLIPALQNANYDFTVFENGLTQFNSLLKGLLKNEVLGKLPLIDPGLSLDTGFMGILQTSLYNALKGAIDKNNGIDSIQLRTDLNNAAQTALASILVPNTLQVTTQPGSS